jgi:hypothetical protein
METARAKGDVFLTALKALSKKEKEIVLWSIIHDRNLRQMLENLSDKLVVAEERGKPSRPLRNYIREREERELSKANRGSVRR